MVDKLSDDIQKMIDEADPDDEQAWDDIAKKASSELGITFETEEEEKAGVVTDFLELDKLSAKEDKVAAKAIADGMHCTFCGAKYSDTKLCAATDSGQMVAFGSPGSHIECFNTAECRSRKEGKGKAVNNDPVWKGDYTYVKCRHEATEAFSLEDIHFFGGSESKVSGAFFDQDKWLVVSLLGKGRDTKSPIWCKLPNWLNVLRPYTISPQMAIDWPDMGIPPLRPGFWNKLYMLAKKNGLTNVLFYCIGGHGRTGTALCSVLVECGELSPKDAIEYVRKVYCKEAVESEGQKNYLGLLYKATKLKSVAKTKKESK